MAAQGRRCTPVEMRCWSAGRPQAAVGRSVHYSFAERVSRGLCHFAWAKLCFQPSAPMI
jgi:hypothetical protein